MLVVHSVKGIFAVVWLIAQVSVARTLRIDPFVPHLCYACDEYYLACYRFCMHALLELASASHLLATSPFMCQAEQAGCICAAISLRRLERSRLHLRTPHSRE
jgi:hypothetical protein